MIWGMKNESENREHHEIEIKGDQFVIEITKDLTKEKMIEITYELLDFYNRQDQRTMETRFGTRSYPRVCDIERILSRTDIAVCIRDKDGTIVGFAELARLGNTSESEIGVLTDIGHRRQGIGITLVRELILTAANSTDIKSVNGYVCVENIEILQWTHKMMTKGFPVTLKYIRQDGLYWVKIDLEELRTSQDFGDF